MGDSITMPSSLVFLVSNIQTLVTIKLDSDNYLLWHNQVRHALSANGYLDFVEGKVACPSTEITNASNNRVSNPEHEKWKMTNEHLLSCLTATISSSIQTHLLGLDLVSEVWSKLSSRFSSLSRSHVHELRQKLLTIKKTKSLQDYLNQIAVFAHKLAACGSPEKDEDLIFYVLNGLPEEYNSIKSSVRLRAGELKYEEFLSLLETEEIMLQKSQSKSDLSLDNSAVLVANVTQTPGVHALNSDVNVGDSRVHSNSVTHSSSLTSNSGSVMPPQQFSQIHPQQYQSQASYFPPYIPQPQYNRNRGFGRGRGSRGSFYQPWGTGGCQICFKTNHTAATCFHRLNLGYQSPQVPPGQHHMSSYPGLISPSSYGSSYPFQGVPPAGSSRGQVPQVYFAQPRAYSQVMPHAMSPSAFSAHDCNLAQSNVTSPGSYTSSGNWFFDSGATSHVTNNLANMSSQNPYTGNQGIAVGNGTTVPIAHSGYSHEQGASQGSLSPQSLSNLSLY